ncbi:MAG: putative nudix hydrolase YeaB [Evtepia sp.]|jgi:8-oxo-dGTP pyrophosphatase MutT (NUDIX family)|nr:putative nudix hydrolase YeaB [Evtepia sp.]
MENNLTIKEFEKVFQKRRLGIQEASGVFAILVPLVEREGELHLLFEVRADTLRGQPSETCFPGGKIEVGETPCEAALRETWEEIGVSPEAVEVIAPLDIIQDISSRVIYPFLGYIKEENIKELRLNLDEVKEVFFVPLSFLRENEPYVYTSPVVMQVGEDFPYEKIGFEKGYRWRSGMMDVPVYEYQGHRVWGLTGRTVRWLLQVLEQEGL